MLPRVRRRRPQRRLQQQYPPLRRRGAFLGLAKTSCWRLKAAEDPDAAVL
jgi:hypothetical protein